MSYVPVDVVGEPPKGRSTWVIIVIVLAICFGLFVMCGFFAALLLPTLSTARESARKAQP